MADIQIHQITNIYARVDCEPSIAQELSEFFTFTVPGSQFSPMVRSKKWDGKIRLFSTRTHQIYVGLIAYVVEFATINGYTYEVVSADLGKKIPSNFIDNLSLPIKMRDYQETALNHATLYKRAVLISPTASGKSLIIYTIVRYLQSIGKTRGLLIVPTVSLVEQMHGDFKSYGWNADKYCQKIYAGMDKDPNHLLTISTWQSIFEMPRKYFTQFDFVIGDEAHTFKAKSLTAIMTRLINCDYRIGTTGTLDGTKVNKLVLEGLFGPTKKIVSTKELIEQKHLADFKIKCMVLKYNAEICKKVKSMSYQEEIDFLVTCEERNRFIRNLTISLNGNTLVLYTFVEKHGKILLDLIKAKAGNRKVFFVSGGTDVMDRENIRHITEKETDAIIVASFGTFSTGINIRNLHNIVFASPTKSRVRSLQSIGRGLRLGDNKEEAVLYDIADDMRYKSHTNFALRHFEERISIYNEEKFSIKLHNIDLRGSDK